MKDNKGWLLAITLAVVAFVLALKAVLHKRNTQKYNQVENIEGAQEKVSPIEEAQMDFVSKFDDGHMSNPHKSTLSGIEKISVEEFELQASSATQREVHKLINSEEYQEAMRKKGGKLENWNW